MNGLAAETQFHVLAVDDSIIDRKLIERLLKTSSYQGQFIINLYIFLKFIVSFLPFFFVGLILCWFLLVYLLIAVTVVESGVKALEFLGLVDDEDDENSNTDDSYSNSHNHHHVCSFFSFFILFNHLLIYN